MFLASFLQTGPELNSMSEILYVQSIISIKGSSLLRQSNASSVLNGSIQKF